MMVQRHRRFFLFAPGQHTACRSFTFLMLLLLIVIGLPVLSGAQQSCQPDGDVDRNGSVTAADALLAFQQALSLAPLSMCQLSIANVFPLPTAPDDTITASDALCIFQKALGLSSCLDTLPPSNQEPLSLPSGHGLLAGQFTIQPGASDTYGNVMVSCPVDGSACVITVSADGTATYDDTGGAPVVLSRPEELPGLPLQRALHAAQAPIVDLGGILHVGADVAPPADQLTAMGTYDGVAVSSGRVQDGTGADRVLEFLETHVAGGPSMAGEAFTFERGITGLSTFLDRPIVRLAEGTRDEFAAYAVRAVQLINIALPYEQRIVFSDDPAPPLAAIEEVPDGEIFIDFAPTRDHWNGVNPDHPYYAAAAADPDDILEYNFDTQLWESKGVRAGHVWFSVKRLLNQAWVLKPRYGAIRAGGAGRPCGRDRHGP